MKVLLLGGIGAVSIDASKDIIQGGGFDDILLADVNWEKAAKFGAQVGMQPSNIRHIDASDQNALSLLLRGFDVVLNGLPKVFALNVLKAAIESKSHVADLGSPTAELQDLDAQARQAKVTYLAGCGATPGVTNMMALLGAQGLETVEEIQVNFAAFRGFGISPALIHTTLWEFDPEIKERAYYQNGSYHPVSPFSGGKFVDFPEPIGRQTVYIVPHGETRTLPASLKARRVFTRGCFPPRIMRFLRIILEYGFYSTKPIQINGTGIAPRQLLTEYLLQVPEGNYQDLWGYGLQVQVSGIKSRLPLKHIYWTSHPGMDEWGVPGAYTKNVALPLAIGVRLLMEGQQRDFGVGSPETILPASVFFKMLNERGIQLHEKHQEL